MLSKNVAQLEVRSEEHTSELQSQSNLHSFPTRRSSDLIRVTNAHSVPVERSDIVLVYPSDFGRVVAVGENSEIPITDEVKLAYLGAAHGNYEAVGCSARMLPNSKLDRKSTRLNSSHSQIYTLSLHDALPISSELPMPILYRLNEATLSSSIHLISGALLL